MPPPQRGYQSKKNITSKTKDIETPTSCLLFNLSSNRKKELKVPSGVVKVKIASITGASLGEIPLKAKTELMNPKEV